MFSASFTLGPIELPAPILVPFPITAVLSTIAVGCPFCMTMITDGVKNAERIDTVNVKDIAEIVAERLK